MQEIDEQFESWRTRLDEFVQSAGERLLVGDAPRLLLARLQL